MASASTRVLHCPDASPIVCASIHAPLHVQKKRISRSDRRTAILLAARRVFAERGYEGAKTQHIAAAAGVSDALVFRHFQSKQGLYRAVMRNLVREQDASFAETSLPEANTDSMLQAIWDYLASCIHPSKYQAEGNRLLIANFVSDGAYARFVFRRARRLADAPMRRAFDAAKASGDLGESSTDSLNGSFFVAHVGEIISLSRSTGSSIIPYRGGNSALLRDAFRFCVRGLGVSDAAIQRFERGRHTSESLRRGKEPAAASARRNDAGATNPSRGNTRRRPSA